MIDKKHLLRNIKSKSEIMEIMEIIGILERENGENKFDSGR